MPLPVTVPFATQKMDGGRKRDGYGFGPYADGPANWGIVFHTTETRGIPSYLRADFGGVQYSVAPHFTYLAAKRQWIQHNRLNVRSGTLSGSSTLEAGGKVVTNAAKVIQVEIVCYSAKAVGASVGGTWVADLTADNLTDLAEFIAWAHLEFDVPLVWYPKKSIVKSIPMSHAEWWSKRTWGITDHSTSPDESTHWDCGAIRSDEIMALVPKPVVAVKPSAAIIDWLFDSGLAQGPSSYWKQLPAESPEWARFTQVLQGGFIRWAFENIPTAIGGWPGEIDYWLHLEPAAAEWNDFWKMAGVNTPPIGGNT